MDDCGLGVPALSSAFGSAPLEVGDPNGGGVRVKELVSPALLPDLLRLLACWISGLAGPTAMAFSL